ncbi:MAG: phosphotransferase family protein [Microscillaceae bacterium]|jgi:aminoglycoside phosphotransferase (APT) family kinase protein|nr:phosphotransferase family protein [Microscillaceae bacterium]
MNIDQARPIRSGEELELNNLQNFLREKLERPEAQLEVLQFPSGYSNLTYLLRLGDLELVLRRPPRGAEHIAKGHDMGREYKVLSLMYPIYSKTPKPLIYTEDTAIIGAPFYVMERVQGVILRANQKLDFSPDTMRQLNENLIINLAQLHQLDIEKTGLGQLGKPEGYLQRQVEGWSKRYHNARTEDLPDMDFAMKWLAENMPTSPPPTFIHNDYKYDNVILDANDITQIKAVLDWEMSTIGDPFTDFGIVLSYMSEANDPPELRNFGIQVLDGALTRQEMVELYETQVGQKIEHLIYYYAFALFKLGVVVQQIYYRYHQGFTKDERFAPLVYMVRACAQMSRRAIQEKKISGF